MPVSSRRTNKILLILALGMFFFSCTANEKINEPDKVTVGLRWHHSVQFAGLYVAQKKGMYKSEGIKVVFEERTQGIDQLEQLARGAYDFTISGSDKIILARSRGLPVSAIATIFQKNPLVFMTKKGSGITRPYHFEGKTVQTSVPNYILTAMLTRAGITVDQVTLIPQKYNLKAFQTGTAEIKSGYLTDQVIAARKKGYEINIIYPGDYGIHLYGDCIATTQSMIDENPELVARFMRATLKGWRYAIENPEEAVELSLGYNEKLDPAHEKDSMMAQIPLIHTGRNEIGSMEEKVWQDIVDMLKEQGLLYGPVDVDSVYTGKFH